MIWFVKAKKHPGWMALTLAEQGIYAAHAVRALDAKPKLLHCRHYANNGKGTAKEALEKVGKDLHLSRYRCSSLLAANDYQLLSVDAPNVPEAEVKTALRWRLKDMLDYPVDEAALDVLEIPVDPNAPVRTQSMFAVCARASFIAKHQADYVAAKIGLSVIDIPEMAQRNIAALFEPQGRGLALLSFTEQGGLLTISYNGELFLSRRIDISYAQLTTDDIERQTGYYDKITLELQRSLDHFDRQYHYIALSKLMLSPLGEGGRGLHEYLAGNLYIPVEMLDLADVLDLSQAQELADAQMQQQFFMVIGAALREQGDAP